MHGWMAGYSVSFYGNDSSNSTKIKILLESKLFLNHFPQVIIQNAKFAWITSIFFVKIVFQELNRIINAFRGKNNQFFKFIWLKNV